MTTPKPTPREALSHLCWALTHGEDADEDIRVLSAALEQLEWLRKQAEVFQDCNTGLARERDTLRDENAAITAERDAAINYQNALRGEIHRLQSERGAERSRATALAARVEALETCLLSHSELPTGGPCSYWGKEEQSVLSSTPAADLAAHDDRIRRETVERIDIYFHEHPIAWQDSSIPERTRYFHRAAGLPEPGHAGEED